MSILFSVNLMPFTFCPSISNCSRIRLRQYSGSLSCSMSLIPQPICGYSLSSPLCSANIRAWFCLVGSPMGSPVVINPCASFFTLGTSSISVSNSPFIRFMLNA